MIPDLSNFLSDTQQKDVLPHVFSPIDIPIRNIIQKWEKCYREKLGGAQLITARIRHSLTRPDTSRKNPLHRGRASVRTAVIQLRGSNPGPR